MRKARFVLWLVVGMVGGLLSLSHAAEKKAHDRFTAMLAQQLKTVLDPDHVLGDAVDFNGTKVVPIVRMGFDVQAGRRGGHEDDDDDDDGKREHEGEKEYGGRAGIHVRSFLAPQALLIVSPTGDVRVIAIPGGRPGRARDDGAEHPERGARPERPEGPGSPPAPRP